MFNIRTLRAGWGGFVLLAALQFSDVARAACPTPGNEPLCSSLPNPIYGIGGSAQTPLMRVLGQAFRAGTPEITLVYADPSACNGISAILDAPATPGQQPALGTATAKYSTIEGDQCTCNLPGSSGGTQVFDFGLMGNSAPLCAGVGSLPAYVTDSLGPVSSVSVIVHQSSTETSISSSAIAAIYTRNTDAQRPSPWTVNNAIFRRSASSYVQIYLARAAGVMPSDFDVGIAVNPSTNEEMAKQVGSLGLSTPYGARIGFVSSEVADDFASTVNSLAYQHDLGGQTCGYWPDSNAGARDKYNVRTGQYYLWGATHFFTRNDGANVSPEAQDFVAWLRTAQGDPTTSVAALPANVDLFAAIVAAGNIPECAMQVSRATDLGPIASFAPTEPCGCAFESLATGTSPASCVPCDGPSAGANPYGASGQCRHHFWEPY